MSWAVRVKVVCAAICLVLIPASAWAGTIIFDSFSETGGLRVPGAPLAGATTETGNAVWQSYNTNPQGFFFDSGGAGYVTTAIVSSVLVADSVASDTTIQVDVNLNGYAGTQSVMIGFSKTATPKYPYSWPIYLTVTGAGKWTLYDYDTQAHSYGNGSGLNVTGWHTMKLQYDPSTKKVNAWYDSTQLVANAVLAETLSPIVAVGFGSNVTTATMQFDDFSVQNQVVDTTPPAAVNNLAVSGTTGYSATLAWTAPSDPDSPVTAYDLRYSTSAIDGTNFSSATTVTGMPVPKAAGSVETFTVTGLTPATAYYFALKSADASSNWSDISNVPSGTTGGPDVTGPTRINDLAAATQSDHSINLTWTAPSDTETGVASYDVRYSTSTIDDVTWDSAIQVASVPAPKTAGSAESLLVTGLDSGVAYYFAIKSTDKVGNVSTLSNVASGTTLPPDTTPPAAVHDLAATNAKSNQVTLAWTASGDDGMVGQAAGYEIRYSTSQITDANFAAGTLVVQGLTPKASGQAESLVVTGLLPGTTYYFALKVFDEIPNTSALSNVAMATTLPPDTTPPAPIGDLVASGGDAFSTDLTWTAPGDDGNSGQAASYTIRYSTSPIDDGNWAFATVASSIMVPQPAGSAEHFAVVGLQASTQYYFAIKTTDGAGNVSALSNVANHTTAEAPDLPLVTSLSVVEKAGVTTYNYPMTLSLVFKQGDVADNVTVEAGGMLLSTQTDVKVRWPDGSVKHALVSFILPQLQANATVTLDILAGGSNANTSWMSKDDLLATDFEAVMAITTGGQTTNISARQLLAGIASPQYWLKGSVATEFIIRDFSVNVANQLNVAYLVRVYPSVNAIRVDTVVENCWINARGNITYDFTLSLGQANPQVVFSKTGFLHNNSARWRKIFWQGTTPPDIQVKYNIPYISSTGLLPRYDTSLVVPETTVASAYSKWQGKAHDIMDPGIITTYFPMTGGREDIGPYPAWTARYLVSQDNRTRDIALNCGDLSGSIPIHFRETDPARSFYQHIISVDDRPTIWTSQPTSSFVSPADRFPNPIGDIKTVWTVDESHQPSLVYVPYMLTGDYYYLEELYFWAGFNIGNSNTQYRGGSLGIIHEVTRGEAWGIRNVADAASIAPDDDIEKAYINQKVNNSISFWTTSYAMGDPAKYPLIRYWGEKLEDTSLMRKGGGIDLTTCAYGIAPWQDDYMLWSLCHLRDLGYPTVPLINWLGRTLIDRFITPGTNPYRASPYTLPVMYWVSPGVPAFYMTWADVNNGYIDKVGPTDFKNPTQTDGYDMSARAALSCITHLVDASSTLDWINAHYHMQLVNTDPRYAFLPAPYSVGDVNQDGSVDVVDLLTLVDTFGKVLGDVGFDPTCDFNADNSVDVVDLLILVDNWPM